jgi:glycosyltransferase involved in cell wall biosynthesis
MPGPEPALYTPRGAACASFALLTAPWLMIIVAGSSTFADAVLGVLLWTAGALLRKIRPASRPQNAAAALRAVEAIAVAVALEVVAPTVMTYSVVGRRWPVPAAALYAVIALVAVVRGASGALQAARARGAPRPGGALRVLLVGDAFPPKIDGVAVFTSQATRVLQRLGHTVEVVTSVRRNGEPLHGAPVHSLCGIVPEYDRTHRVTFPDVLSLLSIMCSFRPDVIHVFDENFVGCGAAVAAYLLRVPVVWSHHTRVELYLPSMAPALHACGVAQLIIFGLRVLFSAPCPAHLTVSEEILRQFRALGAPGLVEMWRSGVDVDLYHPCHRDTRMGPDGWRWRVTGGHPRRRIILHVGRLSKEKDLHLMAPFMARVQGDIDAAVRSGALDPGVAPEGVHLVVVGDGAYSSTLKSDLTGFPVTFLGSLPPASAPLVEAYASADAFLTPSSTEAFPLVVLEALASGLPVVGPDAGGVPEACGSGVHCDLFPPGNAEGCAAAVVRVLARLGPIHDGETAGSWPATDNLDAAHPAASGKLKDTAPNVVLPDGALLYGADDDDFAGAFGDSDGTDAGSPLLGGRKWRDSASPTSVSSDPSASGVLDTAGAPARVAVVVDGASFTSSLVAGAVSVASHARRSCSDEVVRVSARAHAESMSWDATYKEAEAVYRSVRGAFGYS